MYVFDAVTVFALGSLVAPDLRSQNASTLKVALGTFTRLWLLGARGEMTGKL